MSFNLLDEPWIPVLRADGSPDTLSLRGAFTDSGDIRRLSGEIPTQAFAILRLLLAIHHDAIGFHVQADLDRAVMEGPDTSRILAYLDGYADRFDLFHPERPFFQVAGLRTARNEASGLEKLISDVPNGRPYLTTRGGRALERISAAEAARWLVHCQAFDPSGIRSGAVDDPLVTGGKGYPIGPSWVGQIGGIVLHGHTLAETLVYNLTLTEGASDDVPVWAFEDAPTQLRSLDADPPGPVTLLVWQSRRVRLVGDREGVTGVVLSQGDKVTPQNRQSVEPMTAWRYSKPQSKKFNTTVYMPLKHEAARSGWRGFPAIVATSPALVDDKAATLRPAVTETLASRTGDLDLEMVVGLEIVGMSYGAQEAIVEDIVHDRLDFRLGMLGEQAGDVRQMVEDAVHQADRCVREVGKLAANLARAAGDRDGTDGAYAPAQTAAWVALDDPARRWLEGLGAATDTVAARRGWQSLLRSTIEAEGRRLCNAAGPAAIVGRETGYGFMTAAKAELFWRKALRTELPLAYENTQEKETTR